MEVNDLRQLCLDSIAAGGDVALLTLPTPKSCRGYTLRLCGNRGPRGEIICTNHEGTSVVRFKASDVLRFIERESSH